MLDALAVFKLTEERDGGIATLDVLGDGDDRVDLGDSNFALHGTKTGDGTTYNVYRDGNAEVRVEEGVQVQIPPLLLSSLDGSNGFILPGIDAFDLSGTGGDTLVLDALAVFDLTEERAGGIATLDVLGYTNDTVELRDSNFTANGTVTEDGTTYNVYRDDNAEVRVQDGVVVTSGTSSSSLLSEEPLFEDLSVRDSIPDMQDTGEDAVVLMPLPALAQPVFAGDKPLHNDLAMILQDMEIFADPVNHGDTDMDGF